MKLVGVLPILALSIASCGPERAIAPPGMFFPTGPRGGAYPAALITGRLAEADGCVFIADPYGRAGSVLPLWPERYRAERDETGRLTVFDGEDLVARVGDDIRFGGGFRGESSEEVGPSEEFIGKPIPERCRADDGYWIVSP